MSDEVPPQPPQQAEPQTEAKGTLAIEGHGIVSYPRRFSDEQLRYIFAEVALGRGCHGSFIRRIAESVTWANDREFRMLKPLLQWLVAEYRIEWYLQPLDKLK